MNKSVPLTAALFSVLLSGCMDIRPVTQRVSVLECDLKVAHEEIRSLQSTTRPTIISDRSPITLVISDAQIAPITASFDRVGVKIGDIHSFLQSTTRPTIEGKLAKAGSLVSWLLSNGANAVKIAEGLQKLGLLGPEEAKDLIAVANELGPLIPPSPIDLSKIEKQLECICNGNTKIEKSITGLDKLLANMHPSLQLGTDSTTQPIHVEFGQAQVDLRPQPLIVEISEHRGGFSGDLDKYNLAIMSALLGIAAYLRAQSGKAIKSRERLFAEHAWLNRVKPKQKPENLTPGELTLAPEDLESFMNSIVERIRDRRNTYNRLIVAELVTLLLALALIVRSTWGPCGLWDQFFRVAIIAIGLALVILHIQLWCKTGQSPMTWEHSPKLKDESKAIIPIPPEGLKS